MILLRKLKTLWNIFSACSNWTEIAFVKLGVPGKRVSEVHLRNGLVIELDRGLRQDWGEVFEPAIADVYGTAASDADLFIDIGTNLGSFSCLAAYTHPSARVYAFEPDEESASQAEQNFRRNKLDNITLVRAAVTEDGREIQLTKEDNRGAANIFQASSETGRRLSSTTLDCVDFSGAKSLFVKLDCEGAEGEIIDWLIAHRTRLPARIRIACEYHPWCPVPRSEAVKRLKEAGFDAVERLHFDEQYLFAEKAQAPPAVCQPIGRDQDASAGRQK